MTPHNEAAKDDYAEAVLLPGDPLRAKWIADTFLDEARCVNQVRNAFGFTGRWKGRPVSVQATGMGQASTAIYVHELLTAYGVGTLIRVGTCGAISAHVKLRDIVIAMTASTDSAMNDPVFAPWRFAPCADIGLLRDAVDRAERAGLRWHAGGIVSADQFYHPAGRSVFEPLRAHGALAVEMETSALYTLAARHSARALSICAVSDSLVSHEELSAAERQSSLEEMARLALDVATGAAPGAA
jgi:purine-nucleoside phosphorylase